ncbi:MAG: aminoacyl-histidine dipeptidase [Spirochaetia bacterium]|jgi:dipeptidase D|nr:aminoacyl-histidine dipeptidase [Spirochaetia bacterium]
MDYNELEPKAIFSYFRDISAIPRESGNEEGIRQYLVTFAKKHDFPVNVDSVGNVIIQVPASKGYEERSSVALQGHMDMVCVKDPGVIHDFSKDPIKLKVKEDYITADGTSLGGDDGIAMALALDVFTDTTCKHGPLEGIFTVSEETGLTGAFGIDPTLVKSRKLINLDSEEEGILYIGCAGGIETTSTLKKNKTATKDNCMGFKLSVSGLAGGHSGSEIDKQRANAIKLVARTLVGIPSLRLEKIQGGSKRNVIPSHCDCIFAIEKENENLLKKAFSDIHNAYKDEYGMQDPNGKIVLESVPCPTLAFSEKMSSALLKSLHIAPHGVEAMSVTLPGVVETSANLAIITTEENQITVISSHRSSIMSSRDDSAYRFRDAMETCGAQVEIQGAYPSWKPNTNSQLLAFCAQAYEDYFQKKPLVTAIHAGLECGIINSRIEGMDSISFGPGMEHVHSTAERLCISSTARTSKFLKHLLEIIQ